MMTESYQEWVLSYLSDPTDKYAVAGAVGLAKEIASVESANTGSVLILAGFIGQVWDRWPDKAPEFFAQTLDEITSDDKEGSVSRGSVLLMGAMCPSAAKYLDDLVPLSELDAAEIEAAKNFRDQLDGGESIDKVSITEGYHLDLLWGAFFGSGDNKHIKPILDCATWIDGRQGRKSRELAEAALWSMTSNRSRNMFVSLAVSGIFDSDPKLKDQFERAEAIWR